MPSSSISSLNQTTLFHKILCCIAYFNLGIFLEVLKPDDENKINQTQESWNEIFSSHSYSNIKELFGPCGLFYKALRQFYKKFNDKTKNDDHWKNILIFPVCSIFIYYIKDKFSFFKYKNIVLSAFITCSINLMLLYFSGLFINSIQKLEKERKKKDGAEKYLIIGPYVSLVIILNCLNKYIELNGLLKNHLLLKISLTRLCTIFSFLMFFFIFYGDMLSDFMEKIIPTEAPFQLTPNAENKEKKKKTTLCQKWKSLILLSILGAVFFVSLSIFDEFGVKFLMKVILILNTFSAPILKDMISGFLWTCAIYFFTINSRIFDIIQSYSVNEKNISNSKNELFMNLFLYTALIPLILIATISLPLTLFKEILPYQKYLCPFSFDQKFKPIIIFSSFLVINFLIGVLTYVEVRIQNTAIKLNDEAKLNESSLENWVISQFIPSNNEAVLPT